MGIKGLYDELGTPDRVPLAKLSIDHLQKHGQHIRVAIDVAIWSFQSQAVQGRNAGSNASLRVLYYRLCTLLQLNIHAVFVFDGKNRPDFKRNKTINKNEGYHLALIRRLIIAFGFPIHNAPGEAEAECAYLQKQGIVDAVLSEDVDTLMFGCNCLWRSGQDKGDSKNLEAVQVYRSQTIRENTNLTFSGMVLVALLSGGDYDAGVAKLGMKQAVAAAKAGYGEDLIKAYSLVHSDSGFALRAWRERLETSLKTNHEQIFIRRQPNLVIPPQFPDPKIINYYVNPAISTARPTIEWDIRPNLELLRDITKRKFEWSGAGKLIRTLSEKLLSWQLGHNLPGAGKLILDMHHQTSNLGGGVPGKLRLTFRPIDVVPLPYDHSIDNVYVRSMSTAIPDSETILEDETGNSDSDKEDIRISGMATTNLGGGRPRREYDPRNTQRVWLYEDFVKIGAKNEIEMWKENEEKKSILKEKQEQQRKQRASAIAPPPGQRKINFYYSQKKKKSNSTKTAIGAKETIELDNACPKNSINFPKSEPSPSEEKNIVNNRDQKYLKVITRDSLPGAWKVLSAEESDKYDDEALDDVGVWDLTDIQ
ncbi:hypothetical protein H072_5504 [Dactylellina haptotyla CBS 200.50]|uniref:XPG-I domain-containing protein n=1 Tax=Dactylellina haptotyla (strain CBS 200.50) TaxID=1284197 RepID=S8AC90_DACHA|nr:hypothetical protein H072_5504 [Dactylellina haptotyla CBS 200.50]